MVVLGEWVGISLCAPRDAALVGAAGRKLGLATGEHNIANPGRCRRVAACLATGVAGHARYRPLPLGASGYRLSGRARLAAGAAGVARAASRCAAGHRRAYGDGANPPRLAGVAEGPEDDVPVAGVQCHRMSCWPASRLSLSLQLHSPSPLYTPLEDKWHVWTITRYSALTEASERGTMCLSDTEHREGLGLIRRAVELTCSWFLTRHRICSGKDDRGTSCL